MKLFLATGNKHKIEEIKAIFHENEVEIFSILDGIPIPEVCFRVDDYQIRYQ